MATVVVALTALTELESMIQTLGLPADTKERFRFSIRNLGSFPELGPSLEGKWSGYRFVLGPWRWMIIVYEYNPATDSVAIVTVQDGRSRSAATAL